MDFPVPFCSVLFRVLSPKVEISRPNNALRDDKADKAVQYSAGGRGEVCRNLRILAP